MGQFRVTLSLFFVLHAFLPESAGLIMRIPAHESIGRDMELYDASADELSGVVLASKPGGFQAFTTTIGKISIETFACSSDLDYLSTHGLSVNAEGNLLLKLLDGSLSSDYSLKKFGESSNRKMRGIVLLEKDTVDVLIDPCSPDIHNNLNYYASLPEHVRGTHLLVGKRYKLRTEVMIDFDFNKSLMTDSEKWDAKATIKDALSIITSSITGEVSSKKDNKTSFSSTKLKIQSNLNLSIAFPTNIEQLPHYVRDVSTYLSGTKDIGHVSEYFIQDIQSIAICQGLDVQTLASGEFQLSNLETLKTIFELLDQFTAEIIEHFTKYIEFSHCFSVEEIAYVTKEKVDWLQKIFLTRSRLLEVSKCFRSGNMTRETYSTQLEELLLNITSEIISFSRYMDDGMEGRVFKLDLLSTMRTHNITCWPENHKILILDSSYYDQSISVYIFNSSNYNHRKNLTVLQEFVSNCTNCDSCRCLLMDCAYNYQDCASKKEIQVMSINMTDNASDGHSKVKSAIFHQYELILRDNAILNLTLYNVAKISEVLSQDSQFSPKLRGLRSLGKLWAEIFSPPNDTLGNFNAVDELFGYKIKVIQ